MINDNITPHKWSIIEEGFNKTRIKACESLFSIGNGAMGQRANFEETYSGNSLQGSYIGGIYYPDKTKVGWWKNGYPKYFAKVLNAPNWIGIDIKINDEPLDLNLVKVIDFKRELNMKEGWLGRTFKAEMHNGTQIEVKIIRFVSMAIDEIGAIKYQIKAINRPTKIEFHPYVDAGVRNQDANWDEHFWEPLQADTKADFAYVKAQTYKTNFQVVTYMQNNLYIDDKLQNYTPEHISSSIHKIQLGYTANITPQHTATLVKFGGYTVSTRHKKEQLVSTAEYLIKQARANGFNGLFHAQKTAWAKIWEHADITIQGDVKAQQGIRFNIFQLNQTYSGKDPLLNIGPKGFTGEKYGGSTYWDTEAFCFPFYMATKNNSVARNLLTYRYNHLDKAIENAEKLGFTNGAALYPMVTMNGEECHNEWEITFEEIHRNGAIAFAIFNYVRYTGDDTYIPEKGLEVLIGIARFWQQRASFSKAKNKYVILGVTGPNEYENNINNNFYTNYLAKWCINYTITQIEKTKTSFQIDYARIKQHTQVTEDEIKQWQSVADQLYFPHSAQLNVYLQQDGFLDKELIPANKLDSTQRPLNQKWSWDRILRSPYIKQADTLQAFYFFEDNFSREELKKHFDFYEPLTVHESSLSPCVHSVLAAKLGRMNQAYAFYLRTSRLDLDDYNKEVEEGLHITSMAGTWMSVVEGFGGLRVRDNQLHFTPQIPKEWKSYTFKINFRGDIISVKVTPHETTFTLEGERSLTIFVNEKAQTLTSNSVTTLS